ncbi:MAG TPA: DUF2142 domain-containing protein [Motilibacteraceae bacterium]|nr:DUF2142 domain-containing protein [Motilibacteraceae bacterium]
MTTPGDLPARRDGGGGPASRVRTALRGPWLPLVAVGLLCSAYALASPVGASVDEAAHLVYAWGTATGQVTPGHERPSVGVGGRSEVRVDVPQALLRFPSQDCYRGRPEQPVTYCRPLPPDVRAPVEVTTYMVRYPPVYYAAEGLVMRAGLAAGLPGHRVLILARLASVLSGLLALAWAAALLARRVAPGPLVLGLALGLTPTAMILLASINPNGFEVAAAVLLAAAVLALRVDLGRGERRWGPVVAVPLGTLLLAGSRPLSWVWAGALLATLLVPVPASMPASVDVAGGGRAGGRWSRRWRRLPLRALGGPALLATVLVLAASLAWFGWALGVRQGEQVRIGTEVPWDTLGPGWKLFTLLLVGGWLVHDAVGQFGWETPLVDLALYAWLLVAGAALGLWALGVRAARSSRELLPASPAPLLPLLVGGLSALVVLAHEYLTAFGWQGRYVLPVLAAVGVLAVPGLSAGLRRVRVRWTAVPLLVAPLVVVHVVALVWWMWRNVYGVRDWGVVRVPPTPLPVGTETWTPPAGQRAVYLLVLLAVLAAAAGLAALRPAPGRRPVRDLGPLPEQPPAPTGPVPPARS